MVSYDKLLVIPVFPHGQQEQSQVSPDQRRVAVQTRSVLQGVFGLLPLLQAQGSRSAPEPRPRSSPRSATPKKTRLHGVVAINKHGRQHFTAHPHQGFAFCCSFPSDQYDLLRYTIRVSRVVREIRRAFAAKILNVHKNEK